MYLVGYIRHIKYLAGSVFSGVDKTHEDLLHF